LGFKVVAKAESGKEAITTCCRLNPDIILMDIKMPNLTGIFATQMIMKRNSQAKVIILTTYLEEEDIFRAFEAGAKTYILKDTPIAELEKIIRKIHSGEKYIPLEIALVLAKKIGVWEVTTMESEIMKVISRGLSNQEIIRLIGSGSQAAKTGLYKILGELQGKEKNEIEKGG
jgi:DNA-binding NarL/FixJ family response regulator